MNITAVTTFRRRIRAFLGRPLLVKQQYIVTSDTLEFCPDPIFVMGCHRSGTSLLRRILNSHRNIACPPETNYLVHFVNMLKDDSSISGLAGLIDKANIKSEVARMAFRLHEAFRIANGKHRWADKTPQYVPYFEDLVGLAPENTQFVVIFRNPFDIAYSIYNRGWRLDDLDDDNLVNTCLYVKKTIEKLLRIAARDDVHSLHYEAMVEDPEGQTKALCAFLGEPWDEAMTRPWDFEHNFGTEDPIARSQKKFELSAQNWKALSGKEQGTMHSILGELAQDLGYVNA
jgi:hypothetical protein